MNENVPSWEEFYGLDKEDKDQEAPIEAMEQSPVTASATEEPVFTGLENVEGSSASWEEFYGLTEKQQSEKATINYAENITPEDVAPSSEEIEDRLTGLEFRFPWMEEGSGVEMAPETAKYVVAGVHGVTSLGRGVGQIAADIFNLDYSADWDQEDKYVQELLNDPVYGGLDTYAAYMGGAMLDPVAWTGAGIAGKLAIQSADKVYKAVKPVVDLSRSSKIALNTMGAGATWGSLDYVNKTEGESRITNGIVGGAMGLALGKGVGKLIEGSELKQAREIQEKLTDTYNEFRNKIGARYVEDGGMTFEDVGKAAKKVQEENPEIFAAAEAARKELGLENYSLNTAVSDYVYIKDMESGVLKEANSAGIRAQKGKGGGVIDKSLGVMSTALHNINPRIGGSMKRMEAALLHRPESYAKRRSPLADYFTTKSGRKQLDKSVLQFTAEESTRLNKHLLDGDFESARSFLGSFRGQSAVDAFDESLKIIDELGDEAVKYGIMDKKLDNYWPRIVSRDSIEEFLEEMKIEKSSLHDKWLLKLDEANKNMKGKKNRELSPYERSQLFQREILGDAADIMSYDRAKKRKMSKVKKEMLTYYENPIEALDSYIHNTVAEVEKAKFFNSIAEGSYKKGVDAVGSDGLFNLDEAIIAIRNSEMGNDEFNYMKDILKTRFGIHAKPGMVYQTYRTAVNTTLLGNIGSATTQLQDMAASAYRHNIVNAGRGLLRAAMPEDSKISLDALGLNTTRYAEFEDINATAYRRVTDFTFKYSLFNRVDKLGKETFVNGALERGRKLANNKKGHAYRIWSKKYREAWGDEDFRKLELELENFDWDIAKKDGVSDEIKTYVFNELSDFQPVSKTEMPQNYHSDFKFVYALKSFMLKQADVVRKDIIGQFRNAAKNGDMDAAREASQNLFLYTGLMGSSGMGVEWIKSHMLGDPDRSPFRELDEHEGLRWTYEFTKQMGLHSLKMFNVSEYNLGKLLDGRLQQVAADMIMPPLPGGKEIAGATSDALAGAEWDEIVDTHSQDARRYAPFIGPFWKAQYSPFGIGGYDERDWEDSKLPKSDISDSPIGRYAKGGLVEKEDKLEREIDLIEAEVKSKEKMEMTSEPMTEAVGELNEEDMKAYKGEEKEEEEEGKEEGPMKLEPGIYQDQSGVLFQITEDGKMLDLKDELRTFKF